MSSGDKKSFMLRQEKTNEQVNDAPTCLPLLLDDLAVHLKKLKHFFPNLQTIYPKQLSNQMYLRALKMFFLRSMSLKPCSMLNLLLLKPI